MRDLELIPDHLNVREMAKRAIKIFPWMLEYIPDDYKTQEMCNFAVKQDPQLLQYVPDHLRTREMCEEVVNEYPDALKYVPDWFITQKMCEKYQNDEVILNYQKRKEEKKHIKEELLPITWHPDRWWDWCLDENEKNVVKELWE